VFVVFKIIYSQRHVAIPHESSLWGEPGETPFATPHESSRWGEPGETLFAMPHESSHWGEPGGEILSLFPLWKFIF